MATVPGPNMLQLPVAVALTGAEYMWVVQGGVDRRVTVGDVATFPEVGASFVTATSQPGLTSSRLLAAETNVTTITDGGALSTIAVGIATNGIGNTKIRQGGALSVIGNSTNATANVADISASAAFQVLRVNAAGTALEWAVPSFLGGNVQVVTAGGAVVVAANTSLLLINKASPSVTPITLGAVAARGGLPLAFADVLGTGGDMTFTPNGAETIMGVATWTVGSGGAAGTGGFGLLVPNTTISGWAAV